MSGFADERRAIEERMAANFTAIPCRYENAPFQDLKTPYCALWVRRGEGRQITLGDTPQLQRWVGVIMVQVFVPVDTGTQAALQHADSIAAVFNRAEFSVANSGLIRCRVASLETVGDRNGWHQVNVTVPYQRDKIV